MASIIKVTNGDTVRAKIPWTNWSEDGSGSLVDPDGQTTTFTVYNGSTLAEIATGAATRETTGVYFYDYTIPAGNDSKTYVFEFTADFSSKPQVSRQRVVGRYK
jgi:hypothetical protein